MKIRLRNAIVEHPGGSKVVLIVQKLHIHKSPDSTTEEIWKDLTIEDLSEQEFEIGKLT